jgi:hypothetical protein
MDRAKNPIPAMTRMASSTDLLLGAAIRAAWWRRSVPRRKIVGSAYKFERARRGRGV